MNIGDKGSLPECDIPKIEALVYNSCIDMKLDWIDVGRCPKISTYPQTSHV